MEPTLTSVGRRYAEQYPVPVQDPFKNDLSKILTCKAFRRLAGKTQVVYNPQNPHVRNRLIHTHEVMAGAMTISEALGLNTDLCLAIAAGHDIGHGPYGHVFERVAKELGKDFRHYVNSVVVAQHIEWRGAGLNLHFETLEGILHHSRGSAELRADPSMRPEYAVVMWADKIAYTMSDLNDGIRYEFLDREPDIANRLGHEERERRNTCYDALIRESLEKGYVSFEDSAVANVFGRLREFMFENVYSRVSESSQEHTIVSLFFRFAKEPVFEGIDPLVLLSLLTDEEAFRLKNFVFHTGRWDIKRIDDMSISEIFPYLKGKTVDYYDPDLGWRDQAVRDENS